MDALRETRLAEIRARVEADGWCRREDCRWVNWQSGTVPTHRRGITCPEGEWEPVAPETLLAALDAVLALRDEMFREIDNEHEPAVPLDMVVERLDRAIDTALGGRDD